MATYRLRNKLLNRALHIDYLRLRCGEEDHFAAAFYERRSDPEALAATAFIALSEWDVAVLIPTPELYPEALTSIYSQEALSSCISGSAGYFNYLWDHPVNALWEDTLRTAETNFVTMLIAVRFTEWFRHELGLGAELLFCDFVDELALQYRGTTIFVAHSLGWNDATVFLTAAPGHEADLLSAAVRVKLATLADCLVRTPEGKVVFNDEQQGSGVVAASYSHLLGQLAAYASNTLSLGTLSDAVASANVLVRVSPPDEEPVRRQLAALAGFPVKNVHGELGHYSLSADLTPFFSTDGANKGLRIVKELRQFIGDLAKSAGASFPETTTTLTLHEETPARPVTHTAASAHVNETASAISAIHRIVPAQLAGHASQMTIHRLSSVMTTLLAHLRDPVRAAVVGHLCRFLRTQAPRLLPALDKDSEEDFCHVLEFALSQATDGLSQFQHDAFALGLTGRGGYSRLIQTVEQWLIDLLSLLGISNLPLVTFGMQSGTDGTTSRYRIDLPFNVLFVPFRWHMLFHEVGHFCWTQIFGWRLDSFAIWSEFTGRVTTLPLRGADARAEFLRLRAIIREYFPNYLTFNLVSKGDFSHFDAIAVRNIIRTTRSAPRTRDLMMHVVVRTLLMQGDLFSERLRNEGILPSQDIASPEDLSNDAYHVIGWRWWELWTELADLVNHPDVSTTQFVQLVSETIVSTVQQIEAIAGESDRAQEVASAVLPIVEDQAFVEAATTAVISGIALMGALGRDLHGRNAVENGVPLTEYGSLLFVVERERDFIDASVAEHEPDFAVSLAEGTVYPVAPAAYAFSRLLIDARPIIRTHPSGAFMRSQIAAILSLWHRSVTSTPNGVEDLIKRLEKHLIPMRLVVLHRTPANFVRESSAP
jgi:hypothetical protein